MTTRITPDDIRAFRIGELMNDFREYVSKIVQLDALCSPAQPGLEKGDALLRKLRTQAQTLVSTPFKMDEVAASGKKGNEAKSEALKTCMLDACCRRLIVLLLAYRCEAAARWRNRVLQVQKTKLGTPQAVQAALSKCDAMLQTELAAITYTMCHAVLDKRDQERKYWQAEMPTMAMMTAYIQKAKLVPS